MSEVMYVSNGSEAAVMDRYQPVTMELKERLDADPKLKELIQLSIDSAATDNPDEITNPVRSIEELYDFIDFTLTKMPWELIEDYTYQDMSIRIDQSSLYIYYLFDQPLEQLCRGYDLFRPAVQYLEPIYTWLKDYNDAWKEFLDTEESWNDEYLDLMKADPRWNLNNGWFEDESNWHSFNDFFSRKLISRDARPVDAADDDSVVATPADSLPQGTWQIDSDGKFLGDAIYTEGGIEIKASAYYSVEDILGDKGASFAKSFYNGTITHAYLGYEDYHHMHAPVSGKIVAAYIIPNADAAGGVIYWDKELKRYMLECNSLSWQSYETRGCVIIETEEYGYVAAMAVGQAEVSSVNFLDNVKVGSYVKKGDELGFFLFGGSDCVMIFENKARFELTVPEAPITDSYSHGYSKRLCGQAYGQMSK